MTTGASPSFAELFAAVPVALLVTDPDRRIAHANADCENLLNLSERAMLGQPLDTVLKAPGEPGRRADHGFAAFDTEIILARGGTLRVDYLESQVADRPGWRVIVLHNDAASRKLGHSADRASAARAAVGAAAMLAHEIKNPLSGIRGAAQLLAGSGEGSDELTTLITTEVDRIAALIDSMQGFTDTRPPALASTNIYPLLDHARRVALAGFARDVRIDERFDPSLPPVLIDRDALLQVVINLIKNAYEAVAGQPDARITISTAFRHGMAVSPAPGRPRQALPIELCIIDNGPGAPDEIAEHLFDPFVSTKREGQGLGLSLVDKLIRDMGGIVQYAREGSPPSTVFRILLPRGTS
ncbi:MAG: ATP-binding protein [Sphingomonas sp.]|jgi:two-component system nitrogen regulation sensor histidine kinase GlnL|uniref:two-component system sensor histidine kinase NtrB n=1 Tax=Sphingomonas sp. TaxID=28214 RepID=UPI003567865A